MGMRCSTNFDCDPGMRCSEGACAALLEMGDIGCNTDFDCVSNCACIDAGGFASDTKKCIGYFTQKNGVEVEDCRNTDDGVSLICNSGFCIISDSPKGTCGTAPNNNMHPSQPCTSDSQCGGSDGTNDYDGRCECGFNMEGSAFCNLFLGNEIGQRYLNDLLSFVHSGAQNQCNTERRFHEECLALSSTGRYTSAYIKVTHAKDYYLNFPKLNGNDECTMATWTCWFWGYCYGELIAALALSFLL